MFLTREWDTPRSSPGDLFAYAVFVIAASVILSWVTNNSQGSVLLAMVGHNSLNVGPTVALAIAPAGASLGLWPATITLALLAIAAIVITRGALGHRPQPAIPLSEPAATPAGPEKASTPQGLRQRHPRQPALSEPFASAETHGPAHHSSVREAFETADDDAPGIDLHNGQAPP